MSPLTDHDLIERQLRPWLTEEGTVREPDDLFERVSRGSRRVRQRPGWLVRLSGNGMAKTGAGPASHWREHRMAATFGSVAIVIALAVGIGGLGQGLLPGPGSAPGTVSDAPAEWTEARVEVLSDIGVIPREAIPHSADNVTLARVSVEPGVSAEGAGNYPQSWAELNYVEKGAIAITPDADWRTWRADGTVEDTLAGTTREARAGDTVLSWNGGAAGRFENPGPEEFVMLSIGVGNSLEPEVEPAIVPGTEWRIIDWNYPSQDLLVEWFSAPIAVAFERVTFEPGAQLEFGPDEESLLTYMWLESGTLRTDTLPPDDVAAAELRGYVPTQKAWEATQPRPDTVRVLRNVGDEPASLIRVVLTHTSDAPMEAPA